MFKLPDNIILSRIPYTIVESDNEYTYEGDPGQQEIKVTKAAAPPRKRQYLMWEVAHTLLVASGMKNEEAQKYHAGIGSVLNRLIVDNDLDFLKSDKPIPTMLWVNGIPYTIQEDSFEDLKKEDLGGRVTYDTLYIQILKELRPEIKRYVVVHELAHAILFEANAGKYESKEPFVKAFAWQLLYFLQDNDLSILKPKGQ